MTKRSSREMKPFGWRSLREEASAAPPFTWEGCVVKVADKVAYLQAVIIEDELTLSILTEDQLAELQHMARDVLGSALEALNTTV